MTVRLNSSGSKHARDLVASGDVDRTSSWAFTAADGNALLGADGDDWDAYSAAHLGVDPAANEKTKARYKYPVIKGDKIYRAGVIAAKDRAGQEGDAAIEAEAGELLELIDKAKDANAVRPRFAHDARALIAALVLDGGRGLLAVDEGRLLHQARAAVSGAPAPSQIAVLPLFGPVQNRGWNGMDAFRAALASAVANPEVGAIVLDIDSPGGTYAGTPETAAAVRSAAAQKPVTAVVDSLAASAAYWIASQAGSVVVSPSADVGSIGVLSVHLDFSQMLEQDGVKPTIIRSVPYKAEGNPFEALSPEARANIQAEVDTAHEAFVRDVAAGRKVSMAKVREDFGKGRTVNAQRAVDLGMADRIGTMADVLGGARTRHAFRRRSALAFA
jgi:signal peptide peptidase SppA